MRGRKERKRERREGRKEGREERKEGRKERNKERRKGRKEEKIASDTNSSGGPTLQEAIF